MAAIVVVAGLLGCQQPQPTYQVERSRVYQQDKAEVWSKVLQFLQANDITVQRSDFATGTIEARRTNFQDTAGWAACELAIGTDRSGNNSRPRRARQRLDRDLSLVAMVRDAGSATEVAITFTERQVHPWQNTPFRTGCVSTGALEKALLDAI